MAFAQLVIKVSTTTHQQVTEVKKSLEKELQRQVTYSETLDNLLRRWNQAEAGQ